MAARPPDLGPLPPPPGDLAARALPTIRLDRTWYRVHACADAAIYFNHSAVARFNAPGGEYGTTCLGSDPACCFVEAFGRLDTASGTTVRSVSYAQLLAACLSEIIPARPLSLVDLTGPGLRRLDADARLFAGEHAVARQWGLAMWAHPSQPDGILFPARHDPSCGSIALFDRARDAVRAGPSRPLGGLPNPELGAILDRYDFSLRP